MIIIRIISPAWFPWVHPISLYPFSVFAAEVHAPGYYALLNERLQKWKSFFFFSGWFDCVCVCVCVCARVLYKSGDIANITGSFQGWRGARCPRREWMGHYVF